VLEGDYITPSETDDDDHVDQSTGEITDQRSAQREAILDAAAYEDLLGQIQKAGDTEVLALVLDSARDLPQDQFLKLEQAYQDRREILLGA
jgi:recombination protein RecT